MNQRQRNKSKVVQADGGDITMATLKQEHFEVDMLPGTRFANPMSQRSEWLSKCIILDDDRRILYDPSVNPTPRAASTSVPTPPSNFSIRLANPRDSLHFNPAVTTIGIVTCGGLCPGMNDVIRCITRCAIESYGARRVIGFRYGYWGLSAAGRSSALELSSDNTTSIHRVGGTFLGSSRGPQLPSEMVDTLVQYGVNILFTIGGDGTQRGAATIVAEVRRRNLDIGIMGIPKTIDNDLSFSHRTFGFETAVEQATIAVNAAHAEADSAQYGIGIVKVMGRHSGFIATHATLASGRVNLCFIPEVKVSKEKVLALIERRFEAHDTCVIIVAEGFGQDWVVGTGAKDASGNTVLQDIGIIMKKHVEAWCKQHPRFKQATVKYIDPSYMIRACIPNASDAAFCLNLSTLAMHEAMAGVTNSVVSYWYDNFILVPILLATALRKEVCPTSKTWRLVREITVDDAPGAENRVKDKLRRRLTVLSEQREKVIAQLSKL